MNANDPSARPEFDPHRLAQAESGDPQAQFALAQALIGTGRPSDALPWLKRSTAAGHPPAAVELARILLFLTQSDQDIADAVRWLHWADAKASPAAPYWLALAALGNRALECDFGRIGGWLLSSARRRFPPALRALALYFGRSPHPADRTASERLLRDASQLGDVVSARLLAERARHGESMPADPALATQLDRQLAAAGCPNIAQVVAQRDPVAAPFERPQHLALEGLLSVPAPQTLHASPWVRVADGVLSAEDCRLISAIAAPHLRRSRVFDPQQGDAIEFEVRTSQDASIDPIIEDFWLRLLQVRMAAIAGGRLIEAEPLAVLRYGPGEQYRPHYDSLNPNAEGQHLDHYGQRRTTLCCYLNPVEAGGATDFPNIGVRVEPIPGRAVVFDNLTADGLRHPDSLHAGMPVEAGEKWLATLWLRERPIRRF